MTFRKRLLLLGVLDAGVVSAAVVLSYLLRFDFTYAEPFRWLPEVIAVHLLCALPMMGGVKMYHRVWRFASLREFAWILVAVAGAELGAYLLLLVPRAFSPDFLVPASSYLLTGVLIAAGVCGSRLAWRMWRDAPRRVAPVAPLRRLLIVGAGSAGALVARELLYSKHSAMRPVAFIDDNKGKHRLNLLGLPILGGRGEIAAAVERLAIDDILIAIPTAAKRDLAEIISLCKDTAASVKIVPSVSELLSGRGPERFRDVSVEDLLGRDPVQADLESIAGYVAGKTVLITGAGGSIGSELCRQIAAHRPAHLLLLGHGENSIYEIEMELRHKHPGLTLLPVIADIQDQTAMRALFQTHRPAVVFHAAAHKHVPLMEHNPREAFKNNVLGTRNVAECAHFSGATHFVMISSDKAVNPTSIMGATKRLAEMLVQGLDSISDTKFAAVRFGNVLGSRGSVIPLFRKQIEQGGPVTVTHPDMTRYFMTIPEAVQLVIQAGALAEGGEIFILDMGRPVKIVKLAQDLIRLSGYEPDRDISIVFTGIRPGEKMYEELLTDEEGLTATKHNSIFVGKPGEVRWDGLQRMIAELEALAGRYEPFGCDERLKEAIRRFTGTDGTACRNAADADIVHKTEGAAESYVRFL